MYVCDNMCVSARVCVRFCVLRCGVLDRAPAGVRMLPQYAASRSSRTRPTYLVEVAVEVVLVVEVVLALLEKVVVLVASF